MTLRAAPTAAVLAALLLAVGIFLGFSAVTADGVSCGSAFAGSNAAAVSDFAAAYAGRLTDAQGACDDARSTRSTITWALLIPGTLLLVVAAVARVNAKDAEKDAAHT